VCFAPTGQLVNTYGRTGSGPGEFRLIASAWARGDTIEALDARLRRITRFLPSGGVEDVTFKSGPADLSWCAGPLPDGWFVGGVAFGKTGRRDSVVLHRFSRSGADLGLAAHVQGFARYKSPVMTGPEPLSPTPLVDIKNGRAYIGESLSPTIQVINARGQPERNIRWTPERVLPVRATLRLVIDSAVARAKPEQVASTRRRWEDAPVPQRIPVLGRFMVDDLGLSGCVNSSHSCTAWRWAD
jgi:hypothetical protein